MSEKPTPDSLKAFTEETQIIWDQKAAFWDELMGNEGNRYHANHVEPTVERLLAALPGERIWDVACGNGTFARRLAGLGVSVVATDFSAGLLGYAQKRSAQAGLKIDYHLIDATDEAQLLTLGEARFNAVVCNMALMDMTTIEPLAKAAARALKPGGRFVFSVPHPCFNSNAMTMVAEQEDKEGVLVDTYSLKISSYLTLPPGKGAGAAGEPVPHYYFHRPLHVLLNAFFRVGFSLDGLEEPAYLPQTPSQQVLSWANFKDFPPLLAARLRLSDRAK